MLHTGLDSWCTIVGHKWPRHPHIKRWMVNCSLWPCHVRSQTRGVGVLTWGLLKARSLICPLVTFLIFLLDFSNHLHIGQIWSELSCVDTCNMWTTLTMMKVTHVFSAPHHRTGVVIIHEVGATIQLSKDSVGLIMLKGIPYMEYRWQHPIIWDNTLHDTL